MPVTDENIARISTLAHAEFGMAATCAGLLRVHGIMDDGTAQQLKSLLAAVEGLADFDPATAAALGKAVQSLSIPPATRSERGSDD